MTTGVRQELITSISWLAMYSAYPLYYGNLHDIVQTALMSTITNYQLYHDTILYLVFKDILLTVMETSRLYCLDDCGY